MRTDWSLICATTFATWIDLVMWRMNARNSPTLATTKTNAMVTDACGTKGLSFWKPPRTDRMTVRE